ncbi:hypothetical protein DL96DRAFT_905065 [Flagelloscypha sp. PMI_526]|nr:hypothetical protein DL96DRAFT_905065 [Flagelloscypha sp. PMI_526]
MRIFWPFLIQLALTRTLREFGAHLLFRIFRHLNRDQKLEVHAHQRGGCLGWLISSANTCSEQAQGTSSTSQNPSKLKASSLITSSRLCSLVFLVSGQAMSAPLSPFTLSYDQYFYDYIFNLM